MLAYQRSRKLEHTKVSTIHSNVSLSTDKVILLTRFFFFLNTKSQAQFKFKIRKWKQNDSIQSINVALAFATRTGSTCIYIIPAISDVFTPMKPLVT